MTPRLHRVRAGLYVDNRGRVSIERYAHDVTGRGVEWVVTVGGSWLATARTKREAVAALDGAA